jgi:hypothetical protein
MDVRILSLYSIECDYFISKILMCDYRVMPYTLLMVL